MFQVQVISRFKSLMDIIYFSMYVHCSMCVHHYQISAGPRLLLTLHVVSWFCTFSSRWEEYKYWRGIYISFLDQTKCIDQYFNCISRNFVFNRICLMHRLGLHLQPNHTSGSRSVSPLIFSHTADVNGQISPHCSDYGRITPSIPSDSSLFVSGLLQTPPPTLQLM